MAITYLKGVDEKDQEKLIKKTDEGHFTLTEFEHKGYNTTLLYDEQAGILYTEGNGYTEIFFTLVVPSNEREWDAKFEAYRTNLPF
jgi:hypothetical protein